MRLRTILNPRFPMSLRERVNRLGEWALMEAALRMPRPLAYHAFIDVAAAYTVRHPQVVVPDVLVVDVLQDGAIR